VSSGHGHLVLVGRHAALFDKASGLALSWLYRSVADRVIADLPSNGRVLDVGTGPGRLLVEIARRRPEVDVAGIDPSADMVGHARRHLQAAGRENADVRIASAEDLPFPDASFDVVVSTLSGHHWADTSTAIAEQARVLRPGGRLWVVDLRAKATVAITAAFAATFDPAALTNPPMGRLAGAFLRCHRATKLGV
jgi:ubiquinone/menaquinone biosynthesis C-methylase UbiE